MELLGLDHPRGDLQMPAAVIVALDVARDPFDFAPILILLLLAFVAIVLVVFLLRFLRRRK